MAYELESIEAKIAENIGLSLSERLEFDVPVFLQELDKECLKVKRAFRHQVVSFENERLMQRYFHFHQESLIELINTLHTNRSSKSSFVHSILDRLSGLLQYLEEHFPDYFNQDMKMPEVYGDSIRSDLYEYQSVLSSAFQGTEIDQVLLDVICRTFKSHVDGPEQITFRRLYYLKLLRMNITGTGASLHGGLGTLELIKVLLRCNFNTSSFYNYLLAYIGRALSSCGTLRERLDQLTYYLKLSNQEASNHAIGYDNKQPPISVQLSDWLSQEVHYLRTKQELLAEAPANQPVTPDFKIIFDLSVSQLAFLLRALTESGVIQNKNTSEVIRFFAKCVKTKKSEAVSFESFRSKYYSIEGGAKETISRILRDVLKRIGTI